jgi:hypothetical protein
MRTDGFSRNLDSIVKKEALDYDNVRRPLRGVEIKDDTYGIIKVIRSNGSEVPLIDAGSRTTPSSRSIRSTDEDIEIPSPGSTFNYSNFIAERVIDSRNEKNQIVETFGEPYIFFYGEKPRIMNVQGVLMNTMDFNWKNEFWKNYEKYLRGTKLVELDARIYFYFDDQIVEGYLLSASAQHDSTLPYHVPFQFTLFVTAHQYVGLIDDSGLYPVSANVNVPVENLRDFQLLDSTVQQLRARMENLRPDELLSTTWQVQQAAEKAAGGVIGKAAIMSAIIGGMSDYEAKINGFISNIKTYFYGRRMVVPRGLAGSERYAGQVTNANQATFHGEPPRRTKPLRSQIADNIDEYMGGGFYNLPKSVMEEGVDLQEIYEEDFEKVLLGQLAEMGVDVSEATLAQSWRANLTHTLTKTADTIDFTAGLARGSLTSLREKAFQAANLAQSIPSLLSAPVGFVKQTVPFYIP